VAGSLLAVAERGPDRLGRVGGPLGDRGDRPGTGQDRGGRQAQDGDQAIQFLDYVLERLPFRVEVIQTDNGVEFGASFHWHVLDKGVGHVYIKPRTPHLNGKVERSHRIDAEEFYASWTAW
jgi:hypothetical protein